MNKREKRAESLCFNNISVVKNFRELRKKLKKEGLLTDEYQGIIDDGIETLKIMKSQGQKMENRLWEYFKAIKSLKFERVRGKKRK